MLREKYIEKNIAISEISTYTLAIAKCFEWSKETTIRSETSTVQNNRQTDRMFPIFLAETKITESRDYTMRRSNTFHEDFL